MSCIFDIAVFLLQQTDARRDLDVAFNYANKPSRWNHLLGNHNGQYLFYLVA